MSRSLRVLFCILVSWKSVLFSKKKHRVSFRVEYETKELKAEVQQSVYDLHIENIHSNELRMHLTPPTPRCSGLRDGRLPQNAFGAGKSLPRRCLLPGILGVYPLARRFRMPSVRKCWRSRHSQELVAV